MHPRRAAAMKECLLIAAVCQPHLAASMRTRWILYTAEVTGSATVSTASDTKRFNPNSGDTRDFWKPSAWRQTCTAAVPVWV